jgi:hypothetical protein
LRRKGNPVSNDFRAVTFDGSNYRSGQLPTGGNTATTGEAQSVQIRDRSTDNMRSGMTADGTTKTEAQHSGSHAAMNNDGAASTVATARSQSGTPQTAERVTSDSIVVLPNGTTCRVREAAALGFIKQNDRGQWIDTTTEERAAAQQTAEQDTTPDVESTGDEIADRTYAALAQAAPPQMLVGFVQKLVGGTVGQADYDNLAAAVGVDSATVQHGIGELRAAFTKQAAKVITDLGAEPAALEAWAEQNAPSEYARAIREQVLTRNTAAWRELATKYLQSTDVDPAALAEHRKDVEIVRALPNGDHVVRIKGYGEMSLKVARRIGIV